MPGDLAMKKFKAGTLHSGSKTGPKVTNRKQAIAIMLNEKRNEGGGAMHGRTGKITSIDEHHSRNHATITVRHGKRKRSKGPKGETGDLVGYDQPESRIHVSKEDAKNYKLGDRVQAGLMQAPDADGDDDQDESGEHPAPAKKKSSSSKAPKKKSAGKKSGGYGGSSVIRSAMAGSY